MKVYSWKTLLATILTGFGGLLHFSVRLYHGDWSGIPWIVVFGILTVQGLRVSLTEKGYEKDVENGERGKQIYRARFGRLAPIARNGALIFIAAALASAWVFPWQPAVCGCIFLAGVFYQAWLVGVINEEVRKEKEAGKEPWEK